MSLDPNFNGSPETERMLIWQAFYEAERGFFLCK
jgi:hypothetical protein